MNLADVTFEAAFFFFPVKFLCFDLRALAFMRMCTAAVILIDLSVRLCDLEAFYSNTGVVPLTLLFDKGWNDYFISIHTISGLWQIQLLLFAVAYIFAILLFVGYRTRLATVMSWFLLLSLHNRNGFILQGGDDLLRMVLFWAMFIPWGARYSSDALLSKPGAPENSICSVATIAYLLQICYIYTGSALLKGPEWNRDFTAMYYVYGLDQINYPITKYLFYYPELLKRLTVVAYYFELLVPVLFFIPVKHQFFRFFGVLLIILFHGLNSVTLYIGMFPFIGMATVVGLLPTSLFDKLDSHRTRIKIFVKRFFIGTTQLFLNLFKWKESIYYRSPGMETIKTFLLIFLTVFIFDWNFSNLTFINSKLSDRLRIIGYSLRLDQNWGMFAPGVFKDDGWFILEGETEKNGKVDLWQKDSRLSYKKPEPVISVFKNDRWRKYSEHLILANESFLRGYFCNYSKRIWNDAHPGNKLKKLSIVFMSEFTLPDYQYSKPKKEILWICN